MKNEKILSELIGSADNETLRKIADSHPMLSEKRKDELYERISARTKQSEEYAEIVSGVEVRSSRGTSRFVGFAAALALIIGTLGGGGLLLKQRMGVTPSAEIEDSVDEADEEVIIEETTAEEAAEEPEYVPDYDYDSIARDLTERFIKAESVIQCYQAETDPNDTITFYVWDDGDEEWSQNYGGERRFRKVTDERFSSCYDILAYYNETVAESKKVGIRSGKELNIQCSMSSWIGGDVSQYEPGSTVHFNRNENYPDSVGALIRAVYIDYNGELYMRDFNTDEYMEEQFSSDPVCYDFTDNSFMVSRYIIPGNTCYGVMKYGEEKIYTIILDNGEWKLASMETGAQVEYSAAIGVQSYLESREEYNDINIDASPLMRNMEVTSYDSEKGLADVHGILQDVNGTDAIEITATCLVSRGHLGVCSAEITRLNVYDGTLKRQSVIYKETREANE